MKNILVVGNGYDKAKGLKTSFVDFFLPIVKRYLLWLDNKYPDNELDYWVYNYKNAVITQINKNETVDIKIEDENIFFNNTFIIILINEYFPFVNLLNALIDINPQLVKESGYDKFIKHVSLSYSIRGLSEDYEYLKNTVSDVSKILLSREFNSDIFWMDIESTIKEIVTDELTVIPFDNITNIDWEKFYSVIDKYKNGINSNLIIGNGSRYLKYKSISLTHCIEGLNLFKDTFCNYLSDEVNRYNNKEKVSDNFILPPNFSHVISLNYTSIFKESLKSPKNKAINLSDCVCHVHGKLELRNIVIGTESFYFDENSREESSINNIPFFKFFQKVLNKTDDEYLNWINTRTPFELTFFGFSFSQNDYDFIRELFINDEGNSYSTNQGCIRKNLKKVTIYCKQEKDQFSCLINLAACLGKKHLSSLKKLLNFITIDEIK